MRAKKLEDAAAAAGFAMVNPEDFAAEQAVITTSPPQNATAQEQSSAQEKLPQARSWLSWETFGFGFMKAPA